MLKFTAGIPVYADNRDTYTGIAVFEEEYYLTNKDPYVYKHDRNFVFLEKISVKRPYGKLCYDACCDCFYASVNGIGDRIYILDRNLREFDCIFFKTFNKNCIISGIASDKNDNSLFISFTDCIIKLYKDAATKDVFINRQGLYFMGAAPYGKYMITVMQDNKKQGITVLDERGKAIQSLFMPDNFTYEDINAEENGGVCLLARKHGIYPYVLKYDFLMKDNQLISGCEEKSNKLVSRLNRLLAKFTAGGEIRENVK